LLQILQSDKKIYMNKTSVSIIIPYYKKKFYFKKTISSVLKQTYKNYEVILIYDDKDKSDLAFVKTTIKKIRNSKIIINQSNLGVARSRNIGIKHSKGKFISFLDADDLWHKDKLKRQLLFMNKNKIGFSFSSYYIINKDGKKLKTIRVPKKLIFKNLLFSCKIGLSTVIADSKFFKKVKFSNLKTQEDYLVWLRLSKGNINMLGINETLASWRKTDNSLSSSTKQKLKDAFQVYNKHLKLNYFITLILIVSLSIHSLKKRFLWL